MSIAEKLTAIAENEQRVYDAGVDKGISQGYSQAELDFWNAFSNYGARANYVRAFQGSNFSGYTVPEGLIRPTIASNYMFYNYQGATLPQGIDLSGVPRGTTWDGSTAYNLFGWGGWNLTYIYDMGLPVQTEYRQTYQYCYFINTIEKVRVDENTAFSETFLHCDNLKNLTIEGTIGKNGFSVSNSPLLTHESLMSIINALKDFSGTGETRTVTLGSANINKLTVEEQQIAIDKGWTLV